VKEGIRCKELGDNLFCSPSSNQAENVAHGGGMGVWEGGGGGLLVVVDFDGSKRLKDLEFFYVPMWIRVFDLPLGMMNSVTGKAMGNKWAKC
jgi:hypothetical protein